MRRVLSLLLSFLLIFGFLSGVSAEETVSLEPDYTLEPQFWFGITNESFEVTMNFYVNFNEEIKDTEFTFNLPFDSSKISYVSADEVSLYGSEPSDETEGQQTISKSDIKIEEVQTDAAKHQSCVRISVNGLKKTIPAWTGIEYSFKMQLKDASSYYTESDSSVRIPFPSGGEEQYYTVKTGSGSPQTINIDSASPILITVYNPDYKYVPSMASTAPVPLDVQTGPVNEDGTVPVKWTLTITEDYDRIEGRIYMAWDPKVVEIPEGNPTVQIHLNGSSVNPSQLDSDPLDENYFPAAENYKVLNSSTDEENGILEQQFNLVKVSKGDTLEFSFTIKVVDLTQYKPGEEIQYLVNYPGSRKLPSINKYKYTLVLNANDEAYKTYEVSPDQTILTAPGVPVDDSEEDKTDSSDENKPTEPSDSTDSSPSVEIIENAVPSELPKTESLSGGILQTAPLTTGTEAQKKAVAEILSSQEKLESIFKQSYDLPENADLVLLGGAEYSITGNQDGPVRLRVSLPNVAVGDTVYALHFDGKEWEVVSAVVGQDGTFEIELKSLSPVLFYKVAVDGKTAELVEKDTIKAENPGTGTGLQDPFFLVLLLGLSVGMTSFMVIRRKDQHDMI